MTAPSVRAELAAAIRTVNAAYNRLDPETQARVEVIDLEPVEAALKTGDDDRSLAAVAEWCHRQLNAIREARP